MLIYYFGCLDLSGHYMFSPDRKKNNRFTYANPWGTKIDGGLCPAGPQGQGHAHLHRRDGWTALSFWDRSVDTRHTSNSTFLVHGTFSFEEMVSLAGKHFPQVINRLKFSILNCGGTAI
jgi:hypothetical protein